MSHLLLIKSQMGICLVVLAEKRGLGYARGFLRERLDEGIYAW